MMEKKENLIDMNTIKQIIEKFRFKPVSFEELETEKGEKFLAITNGQGYFYSSDDLRMIAEQLLRTCELPSIDDELEKINHFNSFYSRFHRDTYDPDKLRLPIDSLGIQKKTFRTGRRKWSFNCANCSKKVSSTEGGIYYLINPEHPIYVSSPSPFVRMCSAGCAYIVARDIIREWHSQQGEYKQYFGTKNLDRELKEYITNL